MILVDTSVLIPFLRGVDTAASQYFGRILAEDADFYLTPQVVQEVLQGARARESGENSSVIFPLKACGKAWIP